MTPNQHGSTFPCLPAALGFFTPFPAGKESSLVEDSGQAEAAASRWSRGNEALLPPSSSQAGLEMCLGTQHRGNLLPRCAFQAILFLWKPGSSRRRVLRWRLKEKFLKGESESCSGWVRFRGGGKPPCLHLPKRPGARAWKANTRGTAPIESCPCLQHAAFGTTCGGNTSGCREITP